MYNDKVHNHLGIWDDGKPIQYNTTLNKNNKVKMHDLYKFVPLSFVFCLQWDDTNPVNVTLFTISLMGINDVN